MDDPPSSPSGSPQRTGPATPYAEMDAGQAASARVEQSVRDSQEELHAAADTYDSVMWSRILGDDGDQMELDDDISAGENATLPMVSSAAGMQNAPFDFPSQLGEHQEESVMVKTEQPMLFDHWLNYNLDTTPSAQDSTFSAASTLMYLPSSNLLPSSYDEYSNEMNSNIPFEQQEVIPPTELMTAWPHVLSFPPQPDGSPFPLSKPLIRNDGLLLVGTECNGLPGVVNRIFVTNFQNARNHSTPPTSHITVSQEVRDMHWIGMNAAIVAIGNEIHVILVGDRGGPCHLLDPIDTVHSNTIRELAVSSVPNSTRILSGGFDRTVVLSDLHGYTNPRASSVVTRFDACDVVSSLRWAGGDTQFSWTTDGGDFRIVDTRARPRSRPRQMLWSMGSQNLRTMGGLFTHEYLSGYQVALGFEHGHLAFLDTRMPRSVPYATIASSLAAVGEIRRSNSGHFSLFGHGGFATAQTVVNPSQQLELGSIVRMQEHQIGTVQYKTSGDYSFNSEEYLAVSENLGIVSTYKVSSMARAMTTLIGAYEEPWDV